MSSVDVTENLLDRAGNVSVRACLMQLETQRGCWVLAGYQRKVLQGLVRWGFILSDGRA